jgi:hypothetical protein
MRPAPAAHCPRQPHDEQDCATPPANYLNMQASNKHLCPCSASAPVWACPEMPVWILSKPETQSPKNPPVTMTNLSKAETQSPKNPPVTESTNNKAVQ